MKKPAISIIVPIYNMEEYLEECLDSIIYQSLKDIEIICVNDGSKDSSFLILLDYAKKDNRIKIISQPNLGVSTARNKGIDSATGEFIAFMDPDDWYPSNTALMSLYEAAVKNKVLICGGCFSSFYEGQVNMTYEGVYSGYTFHQDGLINYEDYQYDYGFMRFIYSTAFLKDNGILFPLYTRFQDPPFFVQAMIKAGSFYAISHVVYCYRRGHQNNIWSVPKTLDAIKGITHNLELSSDNGLAILHYQTIARFADDNRFSMLFHLKEGEEKILQALLNAQNKVDLQLLEDTGLIEKGEFLLLEPLRDLLNTYSCSAKYINYNDLLLKAKGLENEMNCMRNSISFKIGRMITCFPRKIRTAFRLVSTKGLKYTVKYTFRKSNR